MTKRIIIKFFNFIWDLIEKLGITLILWKSFAFFSNPVIICYHRISKEKLENHLKLFNRVYDVTSLNSMLNNIYGKKNQSRKKTPISITMDDCYRSDFLVAIKIFEKYKTPCTFFIPTKYSYKNDTLWAKKLINLIDNIDNFIINESKEKIEFYNDFQKQKYLDYMMNKYLWNDMQTHEINNEVDVICKLNSCLVSKKDTVISLREIKKFSKSHLFDFQSHTVSHPKLNLCSKDEIKIEFLESKKYLAEVSNTDQNMICYPYGSKLHISSSYKIAEEYYDYGLTLESGCVRVNKSKMLVPRVGIYEKDNTASIFLKILISQFN